MYYILRVSPLFSFFFCLSSRPFCRRLVYFSSSSAAAAQVVTDGPTRPYRSIFYSLLFSLFFTFLYIASLFGPLWLCIWSLMPQFSSACCWELHLYYRCLVWDGLSVLLGTAAGQVLLFDLVEFRMVQPPLFVHQSNNEPVTCLLAVQSTPSSSSSMTIVSAGSDGRVCLWRRPIK